jgi:hypothetical protein
MTEFISSQRNTRDLTTCALIPELMLYFLDHEYQRHPEEWDFDQLKARFAEALTTCSTVKNSPGLRWTVVYVA